MDPIVMVDVTEAFSTPEEDEFGTVPVLMPPLADGSAAPPLVPSIASVCTDSRAITPGCLFFALKGPNFDAHRFVRQAFEQGAGAAVVERAQMLRVVEEVEGVESRFLPIIYATRDPLLSLGDLARWYRGRFDVPVIGITGSVGKTSTKEVLAAILSQRGPTVRTQGNLNTEIGVPLTLFNLEKQHVAAVVEMAMRGAGQIRYLAEIARPRIGVVTNIGQSHLELLGSQEAIARAKGELLEALPPDGAAVLPAADPFLPLLRSLTQVPVTTFGLAGEGNPDVAISGLQVDAEESRFTLEGPGVRVAVRLPLPGRHNALNAAAAAAAALLAGATAEQIAAGMEATTLPGMRMQVVRTAAGVTLIDDVYNASPASMEAALEHLRRVPGQRRVAVLGDMLELGAESELGHRRVGAAAAWVDVLVAVGERARDIAAGAIDAGLPAERVHHAADSGEALEVVRGLVCPGDAVLVKASRGIRLEGVVRGLQDA